MVYMRTVNITTLKAKASQAIREVRGGSVITVLDRDIPVAKIVPIDDDALVSTKPKGKVVWPKLHIRLDVDPVEYLIEDRRKR